MALPIIVTILAFAGLSVMYKVQQVRKCEAWVFLGALYMVGAVSSVVGLVGQKAGLHAPLGVCVMGAAAGAAGVVCVSCLLRALRLGGNLSLVNIISMMSISIPIVFAMCFLGEKLNLLRALGLALFVVFVVLINEPAKVKGEEGAS